MYKSLNIIPSFVETTPLPLSGVKAIKYIDYNTWQYMHVYTHIGCTGTCKQLTKINTRVVNIGVIDITKTEKYGGGMAIIMKSIYLQFSRR